MHVTRREHYGKWSMRHVLLLAITACLLSVGIYLGAQPQDARVNVKLQLLDATTGKGIVGIVHVSGADGKSVQLPGLYDRMTGLTKDMPGIHWYIVPADGAETSLPRGKWSVKALSGLESALVQQTLDVNGPTQLAMKLPMLFHAEEAGWIAGNTHLHLRGFSLDQSDDYLRRIPASDGLRVMFISYLERDKEDKTYITNRYPIGDLPKFKATGVLFNNGEEHRHNFEGFGQGYGHVMFLNVKQLVQPVSIGPGITGGGFDDTPLRPGIDNAKQQGGTIIWCHNTNGYEDVLNALSGRLDALNVFDGSRTGSFEENYYKYLNIGMKLPISTGTDWFMYDFARVYAQVRGPVTVASWLDAVKAGRCQATNGPLLTLKVDGQSMGNVIDLKERKTLKIEASATGRHALQRLHLIQNGKIIKTQIANAKEPGRIQLKHEVHIDVPAWFAVRIDSDAKNEFDRALFAHSSPVYVRFEGRDVFDVEAARGLLQQVEEGHGVIKGRGNFSSPDAAKKLLALYDEAAQNVRDRIERRK
jgi:hypothetical protein